MTIDLARLIIVATPIGNLGDISPRAVETLSAVHRVCCEDTRRTRALLSAVGAPAGDRLVSLHGDNERARIPEVLRWLAAGHDVALVADAGTPLVSDPGQRLIEAVIHAGGAVTTVPGPSSVLAALVVSGLKTDRFCVEGFLPRSGSSRRTRMEDLAVERRTAIIMEAPARLPRTLSDLASQMPERRVAVARELTKRHEEVWRGTLSQAASAFEDRHVVGEVVLVLEGTPAARTTVGDATVTRALQERFRAGDPPSQAAAAVAADLALPRREVYERALLLRETSDSSD